MQKRLGQLVHLRGLHCSRQSVKRQVQGEDSWLECHPHLALFASAITFFLSNSPTTTPLRASTG